MQPDVGIGTECAACHRKGNEDLCMCPCELVFYCSPACQTAHWDTHKTDCAHGRKTAVPITKCANCSTVSNQNMWCPCGVILYCSRECQRAHWDAQHFKDCRTARSSAESAFRSDNRQAAKFDKGAGGGGGGLGARFLAVVDQVKNGGGGGIFRAKSQANMQQDAGGANGAQGGGMGEKKKSIVR